MEPNELKTLVEETDRAWKSLGKITYGPSLDEKESLKFRRSLYISENMTKGEKFNDKNLRIIRPGFGLPPKYFNIFFGTRVNKDVKKGTPVDWDLIK